MRKLLAVLLVALLASPAYTASVKISGRGFTFPHLLPHSGAPIFQTTAVIDASTEKIAFVGRVWNKDGGTKNITKVGFRFGAITKGGTTDVQLSLQDIAATTADIDGVADQTVLAGNANITSNTWRELTLGSARNSVAYGALLGVTFEYSTFNASDSVVISGVNAQNMNNVPAQAYARLFTGTWATLTMVPNVVLGFDDGTYGTLLGATCWSAINNHTVSTTTTPDEVALEWSLPFPPVLDGGWAHVDADGDFDLVAYSGTTAIANGTVSHDKDNRHSATAQTFLSPWAAHLSLATSTTYRIAVKPTTTTSLVAYSVDVSNADYWQSQEGGTAFKYTERTDAGAWSAATATRRLLAGISIVGADDGASSGGAPLIGPGGLVGN